MKTCALQQYLSHLTSSSSYFCCKKDVLREDHDNNIEVVNSMSSPKYKIISL
jgi:hypothetical protein